MDELVKIKCSKELIGRFIDKGTDFSLGPSGMSGRPMDGFFRGDPLTKVGFISPWRYDSLLMNH